MLRHFEVYFYVLFTKCHLVPKCNFFNSCFSLLDDVIVSSIIQLVYSKSNFQSVKLIKNNFDPKKLL